MNIQVINMPMYYGSDRPGVELGPKVLLDAGLIDLLKASGHQVTKCHQIDVPFCSEEEKYKSHSEMKFHKAILKSCQGLYEATKKVHQANDLPFIIGGDHALAIGSIAGTSAHVGKENFAVVWIDAHTDINTFNTSDSHNVHGMPLAALIGEGHESLVHLGHAGIKVDPDKVFIFAARDIDQGEAALVKSKDLCVYSPKVMAEKGILNLIEDMQAKLLSKNIRNIHISLDIDALDAALVPGTGTPVSKGLTFEDLETLLVGLFDAFEVISIDLVEFNPQRDVEDRTLKQVLEIVKVIAKAIK